MPDKLILKVFPYDLNHGRLLAIPKDHHEAAKYVSVTYKSAFRNALLEM